MAGSSPRLRGTLSRTERRSCSRRFIPAFAGNATREIDAERELPVHPRVCGERSFQSASIHATAGSSPRLRGTHVGPHPADLHNRFIPAFAGNAWPPVPGMPAGSVHPRVCGERISLSDGAVKRGGSSPRLRGTRDDHHRRVDRRRFIPAFAGNAPSLETQGRIGPVHPRVCGERCCGFGAAKPGSGSSPRLRGTLRRCFRPRARERFIPAFAGNAPQRHRCSPLGTVHPRVCGERIPAPTMDPVMIGSSPRLRGTPRGPARGAHVHRFIPAFAGNASGRAAWSCPRSVHPRVCGER